MSDELSRLTALEVLREYGSVVNMAVQTGKSYYALHGKIVRALSGKLCESEISVVESKGRKAIVSPHNYGMYLKMFGLSSPDDDHGYLAREIRLALVKADGSADIQTLIGEDIKFTMVKTGEGYRIRNLGINLEYDPEIGLPPLRFFGLK